MAGNKKRGRRQGVLGEGASHHPTDERLHHEGVLEVADGVAVLGPTLVDPPARRPAPEPVGVFPVAQVVDEGPQGLLVTDVLCDHHLLLDDVRLREVGPLFTFMRSSQKLRGGSTMVVLSSMT